MGIILSYLIILIATLFGIKYTFKYRILGLVILIGLIGSDTDSAGILYAISSVIPYYKVLVRGIILVLFVFSILKIFILAINKKMNNKLMFFYVIPLLIVSIHMFLTNIIRGEGIIISLSEIIWLGTPIFFIALVNFRKYDSGKIIIKFIFIQAVISIIVLAAGPYTELINGAKYAHIIGGDVWNIISPQVINAKISVGNFDKNSLSVIKFAQYHNPNALGMYAAIMIATSIHIQVSEIKIKRASIASAALLIIGIISWFNSLTRGPILMVIITIFIYGLSKVIRPKNYKTVFILMTTIIIGILSLDYILRAFDHILISTSSISVTARLGGFDYAFNSILSSPFFGVPPTINDPVPHILSLKIAAYYGLPTGILISIPFIHLGFSVLRTYIKSAILGKADRMLYPAMLTGIVFGAIMTNGIIAFVIFWLIFVEIMKKMGLLEPSIRI